MKTVVTKGQYARLKNRAPSAVSNWIAEGKISRDALIGEGRNARVWVEKADADLAVSLDPAQQAAQELPIIGAITGTVTPPAEPPAGDAARPPAVAPPAPQGEGQVVMFPGGRTPPAPAADVEPRPLTDDLARRRRADAEKAELEVEMSRRRLAVDEGRWVETDAAQRAWARELSALIADVETFVVSALANEIADRYGLDRKKLASENRAAFRRHRETATERTSAALQKREEELQAAE